MVARKARPPKPMGRRDHERSARIDWILDEAIDVVLVEGLPALTTTRLAARLGYTAPAFYRYFPSKDALVVALEARTAERFYRLFFEAFARAKAEQRVRRTTPARAALADIVLLVRTYAEVARAHAAHFRLVSMLVTGERSWIYGEAASELRALVLPHVVEIIGYFQRAADVGALSPGEAPRRAMAMWLAVHAVLASAPLAAGHPGLLDLEALRREIVRTMLVGWGASARDVDHALG